jgi:preprotein translocase subunit SecB
MVTRPCKSTGIYFLIGISLASIAEFRFKLKRREIMLFDSQEIEQATASKDEDENSQKQQFVFERVYVKESSFKSPNTYKTFKSEWKPEVKIDLEIDVQYLEEILHEVILKVSVDVKSAKEEAYTIVVKQAGIFAVKEFNEEDKDVLLRSYCATVLFPFAREEVAHLVTHGGFPQLLLSPVNFESLYRKHKDQMKEDGSSEGGVVH